MAVVNAGFQYDFFTSEWSFGCPVCGELLEAATRTMMWLIYKYHAKTDCLGGW